MVLVYSGRYVETYKGWRITESNWRPISCRFEASQEDGEPSEFGKTLQLLREHLDDIASGEY